MNVLFLDTCTTLSKELCLKTSEGVIVDNMFHFLQYSNQSQPSIEAREPVIRVLTNLLKYHETSWHIWMVSLQWPNLSVINYCSYSDSPWLCIICIFKLIIFS